MGNDLGYFRGGLRLEDVLAVRSGTETFFNRPPDFPDRLDPIS
jgi:hypothetical protein